MKHIKFIDTLECLICHNPRPTHHHLLRIDREFLPIIGEGLAFPKIKSKGMGTKSDDRFTIPLCHKCHYELHQNGNEREFLKFNGIYGAEKIALFFWENSGDWEVCTRRIRGV